MMETIMVVFATLAVFAFIGALIGVYAKAVNNGRAIYERDLPRDVYEILGTVESEGCDIFILQNIKWQILACYRYKIRGTEYFEIKGTLFVPKKKGQTIPTPPSVGGGSVSATNRAT